LLQLTGRANYRELGKVIKIDLENHPERAAERALSLRIICEYWKSRNINAPCDRDDLIAVTRLVNGGTNGLEDRRLYTSRAKAAIIRIQGLMLDGASAAGARPILRRGSKGDAVASLQVTLQRLGFMVAVDGDFGPGTEVAVARFQREQKLDIDGIVGPGTWAVLEKSDKAAKPRK
jgi:putative chitinase